MRYLSLKDKKRRSSFLKKESTLLLFKSLTHSQCLPRSFRKFLYENYMSWSPNLSSSRIRNRCILTGRSGSVNASFRLSRIAFRELALAGKLSGVFKSSW